MGLTDEARPSPLTKTGLSPIQSQPPAIVNKSLQHSHITVQHRTSPAPTPPSVPSPAATVGGGVSLPSPSPKGKVSARKLLYNKDYVFSFFYDRRTIGTKPCFISYADGRCVDEC